MCTRLFHRILVVVLDSVGVGALPDASRFGDDGAHTLGHTAEAVGGLHLPHLGALGLGNITPVMGVPARSHPCAAHGRMAHLSPGKDTTTGHWELMGVVLEKPFTLFPGGFPESVIQDFCAAAGVDAVLGNKPASGTAIIEELGEEHRQTGHPIVYTSGDSVFQIAAHTGVVPLERLYEWCKKARNLMDALHVGRVIARPFEGEAGSYRRTYDRHDYSMEPPMATALDLVKDTGLEVTGIGKIGDIFSGRGLTRSRPTRGNADGVKVIKEVLDERGEGLLLANLIDFDSQYGHRRDAEGYARCLEAFDAELPAILDRLRPGDLCILTADHGNDPTHSLSTDHTREYVPVLVFDPTQDSGPDLGTRITAADVGATVCAALGAGMPGSGTSLVETKLIRKPEAGER